MRTGSLLEVGQRTYKELTRNTSTAQGTRTCTWDGGSDMVKCGGTVQAYDVYSVEQGVNSLEDCKAKCESQSICKEIFWWRNIDGAIYDANKEKNCFLHAVHCSPNFNPYQSTSRPGKWLPTPPFTKYKRSCLGGEPATISAGGLGINLWVANAMLDARKNIEGQAGTSTADLLARGSSVDFSVGDILYPVHRSSPLEFSEIPIANREGVDSPNASHLNHCRLQCDEGWHFVEHSANAEDFVANSGAGLHAREHRTDDCSAGSSDYWTNSDSWKGSPSSGLPKRGGWKTETSSTNPDDNFSVNGVTSPTCYPIWCAHPREDSWEWKYDTNGPCMQWKTSGTTSKYMLGLMAFNEQCQTTERPGYFEIRKGETNKCAKQQEQVGWKVEPSYTFLKCAVVAPLTVTSGAFWDPATTPGTKSGCGDSHLEENCQALHGAISCKHVWGKGARYQTPGFRSHCSIWNAVITKDERFPNYPAGSVVTKDVKVQDRYRSDYSVTNEGPCFIETDVDKHVPYTTQCATACEQGYKTVKVGRTQPCINCQSVGQCDDVGWKIQPGCIEIKCPHPTLPNGARFIDARNWEYSTIRPQLDDEGTSKLTKKAWVSFSQPHGSEYPSQRTEFRFVDRSAPPGEDFKWGSVFFARCREDSGYIYKPSLHPSWGASSPNPIFPSEPCVKHQVVPSWLKVICGTMRDMQVSAALQWKHTHYWHWDSFFSKPYIGFDKSSGNGFPCNVENGPDQNYFPGKKIGCVKRNGWDKGTATGQEGGFDCEGCRNCVSNERSFTSSVSGLGNCRQLCRDDILCVLYSWDSVGKNCHLGKYWAIFGGSSTSSWTTGKMDGRCRIGIPEPAVTGMTASDWPFGLAANPLGEGAWKTFSKSKPDPPTNDGADFEGSEAQKSTAGSPGEYQVLAYKSSGFDVSNVCERIKCSVSSQTAPYFSAWLSSGDHTRCSTAAEEFEYLWTCQAKCNPNYMPLWGRFSDTSGVNYFHRATPGVCDGPGPSALFIDKNKVGDDISSGAFDDALFVGHKNDEILDRGVCEKCQKEPECEFWVRKGLQYWLRKSSAASRNPMQMLEWVTNWEQDDGKRGGVKGVCHCYLEERLQVQKTKEGDAIEHLETGFTIDASDRDHAMKIACMHCGAVPECDFWLLQYRNAFPLGSIGAVMSNQYTYHLKREKDVGAVSYKVNSDANAGEQCDTGLGQVIKDKPTCQAAATALGLTWNDKVSAGADCCTWRIDGDLIFRPCAAEAGSPSSRRRWVCQTGSASSGGYTIETGKRCGWGGRSGQSSSCPYMQEITWGGGEQNYYSLDGASVDQCKTMCDNHSDCAGFEYDNTKTRCYFRAVANGGTWCDITDDQTRACYTNIHRRVDWIYSKPSPLCVSSQEWTSEELNSSWTNARFPTPGELKSSSDGALWAFVSDHDTDVPVFDTNSGFGVRVLAVGDGVTQSVASRKCARICQSLDGCAFFAVGADFDDKNPTRPGGVPDGNIGCASGYAIRTGSSQSHPDAGSGNVLGDCAECAKACNDKDAGEGCFAYECSHGTKKCFLYGKPAIIVDSDPAGGGKIIGPYSKTSGQPGYVFCARECERGYIFAGISYYHLNPQKIETNEPIASCLECASLCNRRANCRMYNCKAGPPAAQCTIYSNTDTAKMNNKEKYFLCKEKGSDKTPRNACFLWKTCGSHRYHADVIPYVEAGYRVYSMTSKMAMVSGLIFCPANFY